MAKKKQEKITPEIAKAHWGKHYGVGFMRSIGFKCIKISEGIYDVYKIHITENGDVKGSTYLETCGVSKFMEVAMDNGFNPSHEINSDGPSGLLDLDNCGNVTKPNKTGITEHFRMEQ